MAEFQPVHLKSATPNGTGIEFHHVSPRKRFYLVNGVEVPSVTSVLGLLDDGKSGGMAWSAARIWLDGVCYLLGDSDFTDDDETAIPTDPAVWEAELKKRKLLHVHKWGDKADLGTDIHTALERLCEDEVPNLNDFPAEQRGYIQSLCGFWSDHNPDVLHSEILLGSGEHGYAGRTDLIYKYNRKVILADAKTSAACRPSYFLQTAAYAGAYAECGYGEVDRAEILWLRPDGYEVIESPASFDHWLAVLSAYRAFHEVKRAAA